MVVTYGRLYAHRRQNVGHSEHNNDRNGGDERMTIPGVIERYKPLLLGMTIAGSRLQGAGCLVWLVQITDVPCGKRSHEYDIEGRRQ